MWDGQQGGEGAVRGTAHVEESGCSGERALGSGRGEKRGVLGKFGVTR